MKRIPVALRKWLAERANGKCEYCHSPEELSFLAFEVEHIIAEKHGGKTVADNLALACPFCNRYKGTDLGSIDPESGLLTPFFNPRQQNWDEHFSLDGAMIIPLTAEGRVTAAILQLNHPDRIRERERFIEEGLYP